MSIFDDFISLVYPRVCMACGNNLYKHEEVICTLCLYHLPKTNFHLEKDNPISKLFWGRVNIETAAACYYFNKGDNLQHLIHKFKYKRQKEIGAFIGKIYGIELKKSPLFSNVDIVVPVPLHPRKEKKRGYNQSEIFGKAIAESMNAVLYADVLYRTTASETQTKKSRYRRWENVKEIFALKNQELLRGKHVLLVDDVITTGATIEACAQILSQIPDIKISIVTMACANN